MSAAAEPSSKAFIDSVAAGAIEGQQKYGVPASVTIAQAILESSWGKSGLSKRAHNLFGIKGSGPAGSFTAPTHEYVHGKRITIKAAFRAYHTPAESLADHARMVGSNSAYDKAMQVKNDPDAFARALTGTYATDPKYGQSLIALMKQYDLYRFNA